MNAAEFLLGPQVLAQHGERIALICGETSLSYAELAARVSRAGAALRGRGVRPGERVLLLMRDGPDFAAAWLGALHAGAVAIGLNTKLSEDEYRHIVRDSEARLVIVDEALAAARPDLSAELLREERLAVCGRNPGGAPSWNEACERAAGGLPALDVPGEYPGFWLYTSGTTGRPKGIVHAHRSLLPAGEAFRLLGLQPGERVFATSKYFFSYGLEHGLIGCLALGLTAIVCADWPEPQLAIDIVARHRPAAFFSVPSFYRRLLAAPTAQAPSTPDALAPFRSVRFCVGAGERLPAQLLEQWRGAVGSEILSLYGMSETFCACIATPPGTSNGLRTGRTLPPTEARLVTEAGGTPERGQPGVLWLRHPSLALGYANRPEATREQFVEGWFCTRDVFLLDAEGHYCHQGRADDFMKIAGQWVQPGEIEEVVSGHPAIQEAACVSVHDADGFERLALFVATREEAEAARAAAAAACEASLPRHKRPKWIHAVQEMPRTATGKVQRYKLREMLERKLRDAD